MVSHGFREGAKAMSKTARSCHVRRRSANVQRLAILPWPPGLLISTGRTIRSVAVSAAILRCRRMADQSSTIRTGRAQTPRAATSAANAQLSDQGLVTSFVGTGEVVEKLTPLGNKLEQATSGMIVLDVTLEVLGQVVDAFRQDRDLHF